MTHNRKRAGSDAASSAHHSSDASEDEHVANDQAEAVAAASMPNKDFVPFTDGAELHQVLKTPSADLLRLLLSRLRNQTSLSFVENTQRSTIPASDKRIQLVKDYCLLCETQASNYGSPSSAAASIFSTWELADRQDLSTLLHLPIFCLAQSLALLSIHYPTHPLGSNIVERILNSNEPWLAMLHDYISNLGGAKFATKQRNPRTSKISDVVPLASLVLLREITTFAKGRYASKLFDSFNWSMGVLPHLFNMRRRVNRKSKTSKKAQAAQDVSLRRPDIRTLYILFLLSFLQQSYSHTLKLRLLDLGRDFLPGILKGLPQDPPDVVQTVLLHLHEDLVKDQRIPRSKKVEFWNEWACGCVVQLYAREQEHVLIHADSDAVENPSVAELAHHFLLSICTNPGFGICYPDRGWFPRKASSKGDGAHTANATQSDALIDGVDRLDFSPEPTSVQKGKQSSIAGGSIYNKVLSGVLRQLGVAEDLRQQELALSILTACPELVGPYLESSCAGLSVDPRPSSRWLCNVAFFGRVVGLELPSFRNAKVEHLENADDASAGALTPQAHRMFASEPPPMSSILANIFPGPLHRFLFSQGLNSSDRLVRYSTCALLCRCLDRMVRFRNVCLDAITELDEDENGPWRKRLDALEMEARRRIPDISIVIQILQVATSRSNANCNSTAIDTEDDATNGANDDVVEKKDMLSTEVALRLLSLYYQAVPSSAFDVRFNAGKLLTNAFNQSSRPSASHEQGRGADMTNDTAAQSEDDSDGENEGEDNGEINLEALCQVHTLRILSHSARATSFDWTAKPSGSGNNLSYLGMLLSLFILTPLQQVKQACSDLLHSLLAPSALFEHHPAEIEAWLASLPQADTRMVVPGEDANSSIASQRLSDEQQAVITFLDECMLRCIKTPYRYIESARQYLQKHGKFTHYDGSDGVSDDELASANLMASPWLMALVEQFTVRLEKGLFPTQTVTVDALLAFFVRLLPTLCAYSCQTRVFDQLVWDMDNCCFDKQNSKYYKRLLSLLDNKMLGFRYPNVRIDEEQKVSHSSSRSDSTSFSDCTTPADLKERLRALDSDETLRPSEVREVYMTVRKLHSNGYSCVSQILEELEPREENIAAAVFPGSKELAYGSIPIFHFPHGARFVASTQSDFMTTSQSLHAPAETTIVPWKAKDQVRIALWKAFSRSRISTIKSLSEHLDPYIALADVSGSLSYDDIKHFLFVEAVSTMTEGRHWSKSSNPIMLQVSDLAFRHLDPRRKDHVKMAATVLQKIENMAGYDYFMCMAKLVPFMNEQDAVKVIERCASTIKSRLQSSKPYLLSTELLYVLLAAHGSSSQVWNIMASQLDSVLDAVARKGFPKSCKTPDGHCCEDMLCAIIQSVLQQAPHRANTELHSKFAKLHLSKIVYARATAQAKDGALVAAMHADPALALSVSESMLSVLAAPQEHRPVQALPCTYLTLLSALLEAGSPQLAGQVWKESHLELIVRLGVFAILKTPESWNGSMQHAAYLVMALRCASKFGWTETQSQVAGSLLKFVKKALGGSHKEAFRASLLQTLLGLVEEVPELPRLSEILQATFDCALLWLVRRFAEDSNDSIELVQTISIFTSLVERVSENAKLKVQLKKSLVDPVIQAAIKNRLRALDQMQLLLALCSHADLAASHLSRYLGAISAHADFNTVMRGNATIQRPLHADEDADEEQDLDSLSEEEKRTKSEELKQLMVELVYTVASRDAKSLLRAPLLTKLMSFYDASLAKNDRMLLSLFRKFEEECGHSFASLVQEWTLPSSQQGDSTGGAEQENTLEALQSLDANTVFATCTEYPRSLPSRNTIASGYESADEDNVLPGQVYGRHTDAAQRYDPVFLSSLLAGVTAPGIKLTGLQWLSVFSTNVPGLVVCGLSSRCPDMRSACLTLISNLYLAVREADFQEKDHLIMVLDLFRDALDSAATLEDSNTPSSSPFLPTTTTLFIAHALRSVATPGSFIYPVISHFLLQRPELDVGDVPLLYNLLYAASDKYKQERMWMLRFLRDVARSGGRNDWKIFKRRRTWELLASLYDACDVGAAGISAWRAVEEAAMRALIEDTTAWLMRNGDVAIELVTRRGLLTWVWQQVVKEGVMAIAEDGRFAKGQSEQKCAEAETRSPVATLRSLWILLLAQLVRSVDLDRLHRATEGAWLSTLTTLLQTTIYALHNCVTNTASPRLPSVSAELTRTITNAATVVLDKMMLFADDPAMTIHRGDINEILKKVLDLTEHHNKAEQMQHSAVRIQQSILNLAAASGSADTDSALAKLLRRSTALCRLVDVKASSLAISNLFSASG
ncbi:hypothetical protein NDA14_001308 [Ustilago hordei]|nr:hypothetical protein NDA14_001308 [Ustilago hordei]